MSTLITINAGGDALLARNAQQVQANRFAQLERENAKKVEAEGQKQREERLAAEGRNPDGTLKSAAYNSPQWRGPEPAANRTTGLTTYVGPSAAPITVDLGPSADGDESWYQLQTTKARSIAAERSADYAYLVSPYEYESGTALRTNIYLPTGGPSGASAILLEGQNVTDIYLTLETQGNTETNPLLNYVYFTAKKLTRELYVKVSNAAGTLYLDLICDGLQLNIEDGTGSLYYFDSQGEGTTASFNYVLPPGQWVHVASTFDNGIVAVFIGGTEMLRVTTQDTEANSATGNTNITYYDFGFLLSGQPFSMGIHGWKISNRVLYNQAFMPPPSIRF